jgi:hypothetical protein
MEQRVPRRAWYSGAGPGRRPRLLVEDNRPALAVSDFSRYQQAGFDVAFCSGPDGSPAGCPLLAGQPCALVAGADVVLHGLDPELGIAAAIQRRYPARPVVAAQRRRPDGSLPPVPPGCLPLASPSSVPGQVEALRRALAGQRAPQGVWDDLAVGREAR